MGVGGDSCTKGPVPVPLVLYSVMGTVTSSAPEAAGAYFKYSSIDEVLIISVTKVTVLDINTMPES